MQDTSLRLADTKLRALEAIRRFTEGLGAKRAAESVGFSWPEFWQLKEAHDDLRDAFDHAARGAGYALISAAQDATTEESESPVHHKRLRARVDSLIRIAEKLNPRDLGTRTTVTHEGTINLLGSRLADAEKTLATTPRQYLGTVLDAQIVDAPTPHALASPDHKSGDQPKSTNAVDIFEE